MEMRNVYQPTFKMKFKGHRNARTMVLSYIICFICFVDRCLSLCPFSFDHCVV